MEIISYLMGKVAGKKEVQPSGTINITSNGDHNVSSYAAASVSVPNTYTAEDDGKIVSGGTLVDPSDITMNINDGRLIYTKADALIPIDFELNNGNLQVEQG